MNYQENCKYFRKTLKLSNEIQTFNGKIFNQKHFMLHVLEWNKNGTSPMTTFQTNQQRNDDQVLENIT